MDLEYRLWDGSSYLEGDVLTQYLLSPTGEIMVLLPDLGRAISLSGGSIEVETFTGMVDIEGNKIYKGDVVEITLPVPASTPYPSYREGTSYFEVGFFEGSYELTGNDKFYAEWFDYAHDSHMDVKVVGTFHDSLGLLDYHA